MAPDQLINYFNGHLIVTKVENSGAFLSLGNDLPGSVKSVLLSILPTLVLIFGLFYLFSKTSMPAITMIGLGSIVGGGIGNIFDRIVHGSVTDFLYIHFDLFHTGVFNMADVSIMAGTGLILLQSLVRKKTSDHLT